MTRVKSFLQSLLAGFWFCAFSVFVAGSMAAISTLAVAAPGHQVDDQAGLRANAGFQFKNGKAIVLDEKGAISAATLAVKSLRRQGLPVEGSLLEETWEQLLDEDKTITKKGPGFFVVSFENKRDKKRLYVLISSSGALYDANYTGEFEGL